MNCKNCQDTLEENAHFCDNCGAKVVLYRITFKQLLLDFFINTFGVDSRFFLTLKKMITHPDDVINEYLTGVRRRYVNPFAFLAVGAGLSLLIFNYFADDFIRIQSTTNTNQIKEIKKTAEKEIVITPEMSEKEIQKLYSKKKVAQMQLKFMDKWMQFMLRYFNLLTFVFLFIYAILSKWTYWKPHNFGEHIVINAYVYGFATYFTIISFIVAMLVHPDIYTFSLLIYIIYYLYVFGKLYNYGILKSIFKLLRFLIGFAILFIILTISAGVIGYLLGRLGIVSMK